MVSFVDLWLIASHHNSLEMGQEATAVTTVYNRHSRTRTASGHGPNWTNLFLIKTFLYGFRKCPKVGCDCICVLGFVHLLQLHLDSNGESCQCSCHSDIIGHAFNYSPPTIHLLQCNNPSIHCSYNMFLFLYRAPKIYHTYNTVLPVIQNSYNTSLRPIHVL